MASANVGSAVGGSLLASASMLSELLCVGFFIITRKISLSSSSAHLRHAEPSPTIVQYGVKQPRSRQQHHEVCQKLTVQALRPIWLGRDVPILIIYRQHVCFRKFMECVNKQLDHKHHEKYGRYLKESS